MATPVEIGGVRVAPAAASQIQYTVPVLKAEDV